MREAVEGLLGQSSVGRDLAAVDGQQRRRAVALVESEDIVAGDVLRLLEAVVVERADAGERPTTSAGPIVARKCWFAAAQR